jgi:hypothetical protein
MTASNRSTTTLTYSCDECHNPAFLLTLSYHADTPPPLPGSAKCLDCHDKKDITLIDLATGHLVTTKLSLNKRPAQVLSVDFRALLPQLASSSAPAYELQLERTGQVLSLPLPLKQYGVREGDRLIAKRVENPGH